MKEKEVLRIYLEQYELLEEDIMELRKYVKLDSKNYSTFSSKLLKIFMQVCSEIDSILDEYIRQNDLQTDNKYMNFCQKIQEVQQAVYDRKQVQLSAERVRVSVGKFNGSTITPFGQLSSSETTNWWHAHNHVKHNRTKKDDNGGWNYEKANLKNVLYAMAGLFIILYAFFSNELLDEDNDIISSRLFKRIP